MIAIRILRVVGKAVGLTAVGGFLFAGIFAAPLPRQAAETQWPAPAGTRQPAGDAAPSGAKRKTCAAVQMDITTFCWARRPPPESRRNFSEPDNHAGWA